MTKTLEEIVKVEVRDTSGLIGNIKIKFAK